jgi:hypothetical protein
MGGVVASVGIEARKTGASGLQESGGEAVSILHFNVAKS